MIDVFHQGLSVALYSVTAIAQAFEHDGHAALEVL